MASAFSADIYQGFLDLLFGIYLSSPMDSSSPTFGVHLEHPPQRTVSLLRSKEIHSLANERKSETSCSITGTFISKLNFPVPKSCPAELPRDWEKESAQETNNNEHEMKIAETDEPLILISPSPSTISSTCNQFNPTKGLILLEPDDDLEFQIPLMTSLFYQEDGWPCPSRKNSQRKLRRNASINSGMSLPRDVFSWYSSPAMTPRSGSPAITPPMTSTSPEFGAIPSKARNLGYPFTCQTLGSTGDDFHLTPLRSHSTSKRIAKSGQGPSRKLPPVPSSLRSIDTVSLEYAPTPESPWTAPSIDTIVIPGHNKHTPGRELPVPPLLSPRSKAKGPLPPRPTIPPPRLPSLQLGNIYSFLSLKESPTLDSKQPVTVPISIAV